MKKLIILFLGLISVVFLLGCAKIEIMPSVPGVVEIIKYSGGKIILKDTVSTDQLIYSSSTNVSNGFTAYSGGGFSANASVSSSTSNVIVGYYNSQNMYISLSGDFVVKQIVAGVPVRYKYKGKIYDSEEEVYNSDDYKGGPSGYGHY